MIIKTTLDGARKRALRNIKPDEELFFDYGDYYWEQMGMDPHQI